MTLLVVVSVAIVVIGAAALFVAFAGAALLRGWDE